MICKLGRRRMGGESSLGAKVSGISLLIISPASNAHFSDVKRREYFNMEKILEKARHRAMACWGAQNESSVENGKAFCEKAAGEEAIISWSLFCAISPDTPSTRRVGAECADGSFFFQQVVHHKLFRKRYFIKI